MAIRRIPIKQIKDYYYCLYGIIIRSNWELPYLVISEKRSPNLSVNIIESQESTHPVISDNSIKVYQSSGMNTSNIPYLQVFQDILSEQAFLIFKVSDSDTLATITINHTGNKVQIYLAPNKRFKDAITYFIGPVMGSVLRLKNVVALHASAVNINGKAILFIGEKSAGKSTLTAAFASFGYSILSDDIAALTFNGGKFLTHPGYPYLRVQKESSEFFDKIELQNDSKVLSFDNKYYLPLNSSSDNWSFTNSALPIGGIYFLEPRNSSGIIGIRNNPDSKNLMRLITNVYSFYITSPIIQTNDFFILNNIVCTTNIYSLDRPDELVSLNKVCEMIVSAMNI